MGDAISRISTYLFKSNGPPFTVPFVQRVYSLLSVKQLTTTVYHPKPNGQTKGYKKTIVARVRPYVAEKHTDWDDFLYPVTFANNA